MSSPRVVRQSRPCPLLCSRAVRLALDTADDCSALVGGNLLVPGNQLFESAFFVEIPEKNIKFPRIPVYLEIFSGEQLLQEIRTSFIGPEISR